MKHLPHFFQEHFHGAVTCPLCRKKYDALEAHVITSEEGVELVHVECRRCRGAIVATVVSSQSGMMTVMGIVTDLSSHDLFRLRGKEPVTSNEVLALRASLRSDGGAALLTRLRAMKE